MTFRTAMLTTALTGSMAFSAVAGSETYSEKGHDLQAGQTGETTTVIDKDVYSENGQKIVTIGAETRADADVADDQDSWKRNEGAASTSVENVLAVANPGTIVRAYNGEEIGTVAYTTQSEDKGNIVFVNISPDAGLPAEVVGIQIASLQTVPNTETLEWVYTVEDLERKIIDALNS